MGLSVRDLRKLAFRPVKSAINQVDFVKIYKALAKLEPGCTWLEQDGPPDPAFADQEEIVLKTIEMTAAQLAAQGENVSLKEIEEHARSISCKYDYEIHKTGKAGVFTLLAHLWDQEDINRIFISEDRRELPYLDTLLKARREGKGVVYLINHSTHWDEFIVILVLEQLGIHMPLFAAGSNMMATPSLEKILMTGSYLIIRKGATKTYLATLFQYCRALGEMGKQQGIFLEAWAGGARTRDGSLRYPRRLVTLQGALASEKDILIQPLVISYSAVPEDLSLSERSGSLCWINGMKLGRQLLRRPHRPFRAFGRSLDNLYGRAFISFCRPRLLSELDQMHAQDPSDMARDEFVALYSMREIAKAKKIMASQLAARGLIRARTEGSTDLVGATQAELNDLIEYHRRTFGQDPDLEDYILKNPLDEVIRDGLSTLNRRKVIKGRDPSGRKDIQVLMEHALQYYATHGDRRLYSPSARENIVIVGTGAWGYGAACLIGKRTLADKRYNNSSVTLFDPREDLITAIMDTRVQPVHFPKVRLPKNVFPSSDAVASFRKATDVVVTTSVEFFETDVRRLLAETQQSVNLIIVTRGFEQTAHRLPIQIASAVVRETGRSDVSLLVLSGPITPPRPGRGYGRQPGFGRSDQGRGKRGRSVQRVRLQRSYLRRPHGSAGGRDNGRGLYGSGHLFTPDQGTERQGPDRLLYPGDQRGGHSTGRGHGRPQGYLFAQQPGLDR